MNFALKLSQKTGKTYRLPSEAEWEYACRAGERHEYCGSDSIDSVGWIQRNGGRTTHAVAGKKANAWGLSDMSGNVWEWVQDCWHSDYNGAPADGSVWQGGDCARRVLRGGSWGNRGDEFTRAAYRDGVDMDASPDTGFRLVRTTP